MTNRSDRYPNLAYEPFDQALEKFGFNLTNDNRKHTNTNSAIPIDDV